MDVDSSQQIVLREFAQGSRAYHSIEAELTMPEETQNETPARQAGDLTSAGAAVPGDKSDEEQPFLYFLKIGDVYDGPLDLLLALIKKQNLDIWDLPMGRITVQFLAYVKKIPPEEADSAAEFCYMASQLIVIKSRMLLPIERAAAENGAAEDPRKGLIERLLEYEQVTMPPRCSPRDKKPRQGRGLVLPGEMRQGVCEVYKGKDPRRIKEAAAQLGGGYGTSYSPISNRTIGTRISSVVDIRTSSPRGQGILDSNGTFPTDSAKSAKAAAGPPCRGVGGCRRAPVLLVAPFPDSRSCELYAALS
jgi:hypothetical protein